MPGLTMMVGEVPLGVSKLVYAWLEGSGAISGVLPVYMV